MVATHVYDEKKLNDEDDETQENDDEEGHQGEDIPVSLFTQFHQLWALYKGGLKEGDEKDDRYLIDSGTELLSALQDIQGSGVSDMLRGEMRLGGGGKPLDALP